MMKTIGLILMGLGLMDLVIEFVWGFDMWAQWFDIYVEETLDPLLGPGLVVFGGAALYLDSMVG